MFRRIVSVLAGRCGRVAVVLAAIAVVGITHQILFSIENLFGITIVDTHGNARRHFARNIAERSYEDFLCHEPIDAVYTWVNGSDPWMQRNMRYYRAREAEAEMRAFETDSFNATWSNETGSGSGSGSGSGGGSEDVEDKTNPSRFQDNQELRYSIRSLIKNAGWIRNIYIVTNGQVPHWLDIAHPRIKVVPHHDIYTNASHLPVFASPSIECHLHRIEGLSRRFIYLNDDTFFGRPVHPEDFVSQVSGHRIYLSWPVPNCAEGCPSNWVGDGYCDKTCNNAACDWDADDCKSKDGAAGGSSVPAPAAAHNQNRWVAQHCHSGCPDSWLGDRFCDRNCNNRECGYDALDCGIEDVLAEQNTPRTDSSGSGSDDTLPRDYVFSTLECDEWATATTPQHRTLHLDNIVVPREAFLLVVNISQCYPLGTGTVTSGTFLNSVSESLRIVAVSQLYKLLLVMLKADEPVRPYFQSEFELVGEVPTETEQSASTSGDTPATLRVLFNVTFSADRPTQVLDEAPMDTDAAPADDGSDVAVHEADVNKNDEAPMQNDAPIDEDAAPVDTTGSDTLASAVHGRRLLSVDIDADADAGLLLSQVRIIGQGQKHAEEEEEEPQAQQTSSRKLLMRRQEENATDALWRTEGRKWLEPFGGSLQGDDRAELVDDTRRKLLDTFGDSLKQVNRLYTKKFGTSARRVPSHMPHFIDSQVVREMHSEWSDRFEATSSHRFRSPVDMQYSFSHMYWITHAEAELSPWRFFAKELDFNDNGILDPAEYRRTALLLWERKVEIEKVRSIILPPGVYALRDIAAYLVPTAAPNTASKDTSSSTSDKSHRVSKKIVELWRANLTQDNDEDLYDNTLGFGFDETELGDDDDDDMVHLSATPTLTPSLEHVDQNITHCENITLPYADTNGSVYFVTKLVCKEVIPIPETAAPLIPETDAPYSYKAPPPEEEKTMGDDYVRAVVNLVHLAAQGVGMERTQRPSVTGRLNAYLFNGSHLADLLLTSAPVEKRYQHVVMDESEISFFMVRDNATQTRHQMDHMLYQKSKFMCINDNINHSSPTAPEVKKVLLDFMQEYFPIPTDFELPDGVINEHLHTFSYPLHKRSFYGWKEPSLDLDDVFLASMGISKDDDRSTPATFVKRAAYRFGSWVDIASLQVPYLYLLDLRVAAVVCVALFFAGLRVARAILRFLFGRRRRAPVPSGVLS